MTCGFRCLFLAEHFSVISLAPQPPHKAFRSYKKLTLLLRNVSEKRKDQGVTQGVSLLVQED